MAEQTHVFRVSATPYSVESPEHAPPEYKSLFVQHLLLVVTQSLGEYLNEVMSRDYGEEKKDGDAYVFASPSAKVRIRPLRFNRLRVSVETPGHFDSSRVKADIKAYLTFYGRERHLMEGWEEMDVTRAEAADLAAYQRELMRRGVDINPPPSDHCSFGGLADRFRVFQRRR